MTQRAPRAPQTPTPIYSAINNAIPYAAGAVVLYAFLGHRKEQLLEAMFWGGMAVQVYDRVQEARRRGTAQR